MIRDISANPESYALGEYCNDINSIAEEFSEDIDSMIERLMFGPEPMDPNDPSDPERTVRLMEKERLLGRSGEAKTNVWRRLREKVERFIFGGESMSDKLAALEEYTEYGTTVIESVENIFSELIMGKSVSEGIGLMKQGFSSASRRLSNES